MGGHACGTAVGIDGDVNHEGRVRVLNNPAHEVFSFDSDPDFNTGSTGPRYASVAAEELADVNRGVELHRVDADGDARFAGVPHCADGAGFVDKLHHDASVDGAVGIGVFRLHELLQGKLMRIGQGCRSHAPSYPTHLVACYAPPPVPASRTRGAWISSISSS